MSSLRSLLPSPDPPCCPCAPPATSPGLRGCRRCLAASRAQAPPRLEHPAFTPLRERGALSPHSPGCVASSRCRARRLTRDCGFWKSDGQVRADVPWRFGGWWWGGAQPGFGVPLCPRPRPRVLCRGSEAPGTASAAAHGHGRLSQNWQSWGTVGDPPAGAAARGTRLDLCGPAALQ